MWWAAAAAALQQKGLLQGTVFPQTCSEEPNHLNTKFLLSCVKKTARYLQPEHSHFCNSMKSAGKSLLS